MMSSRESDDTCASAFGSPRGVRVGGEGVERGPKAGERRADHARADLAGAGDLARHPRVDKGRDARLHDLADIDADGRAAVVEGRDAEMRVLAETDLRHLLGHRDGLTHAAPA